MFKSNGKYEYLIVCLGNPGREYAATRHNAGFMAAEKLREKCGGTLLRSKHKSLVCDVTVGGKKCMLCMPQTYMNLSGAAVLEVTNFYKMNPAQVIIVFDDIDLPLGKIRVRKNGSAGGHNGIKDIIAALGTSEIQRVKIGVGAKPNPEYDLKDWVLGKISKAQQPEFEQALNRAADAVCEVILSGAETAMNKFNG